MRDATRTASGLRTVTGRNISERKAGSRVRWGVRATSPALTAVGASASVEKMAVEVPTLTVRFGAKVTVGTLLRRARSMECNCSTPIHVWASNQRAGTCVHSNPHHVSRRLGNSCIAQLIQLGDTAPRTSAAHP